MRPVDCRAARALLNIRREQLAAKSNLAVTTIEVFERGIHAIRNSSLQRIEQALKSLGVVFLDDENGKGVRLSQPIKLENPQRDLSFSSEIGRRLSKRTNVIDPRLARAARALLGWDQKSASAQIGISAAALNEFESDKTVPQRRTASKITTALQEHGVSLSRENNRLVVHLRKL